MKNTVTDPTISQWKLHGNLIYRTHVEDGHEVNRDMVRIQMVAGDHHDTTDSEEAQVLVNALLSFLQLAELPQRLPVLQDTYVGKISFAEQRTMWALKSPIPDEALIQMYMRFDRNLNPHNDSYKPPLRSREQIISDYCLKFADNTLMRQYPYEYREWLRSQGYQQNPHTEVWEKR